MRAFLVGLMFVASPLLAQQAQPAQRLTAADYAHAERFLGASMMPLVSGTAGRANWLDSERFWYRAVTPDGAVFHMVDARRRTRAPAFDHARLAQALSAASGSEVHADRLPFQMFTPSPDGRSVTFSAQGNVWTCDTSAYTCAAAPSPTPRPSPPANSRLSPDGSLAVYIRDHNLWVRQMDSGTDMQVTTDGVEDYGYATDNAGWTHSDRPILTWSPDGRQVATFQHDSRGVGRMHLVSTKVGRPELQSWAYPVPGDSVVFSISRVIVREGPDGMPQVVRLQMPPDAHRSTVSDHISCGGNLCDAKWYPDGSHLAFISSSRDHKQAWLRIANATTGEVRTVLEERSDTHIGDAGLSSTLWQVLPASNELIWWSQRDNWNHLYLYDLRTGQLKNRITTGEGNVLEVVHVDERARNVYFIASGREEGRDPYFRHLYRIGFNGRNLRLLTPEVANHNIVLSPDARYFVDTYSTPDTPPVTVLRNVNGELLQTLERADVSRLQAMGWKPPTPIRMKARDGVTDIYGLMYTPTTLDSNQRYPIVNRIYPGPQAGSVGSRNFSPARSDNQALAELGFVVVEIDGMGTPGRSKEFHDAYYGNMIDNTLPDQVAGMRELAERYPFIDIDRVGIWGHSGGGFATAAAMFTFPDFFKVGVSQAGNHDNRNYEDDWGERYQGLLTRNGDADSYAQHATQTHAGNLNGKLMLAHGAMDDNVPVFNTMLVVDALIKAGKDFDLIVFPHARHGFGVDNNYMMRRRWDYFVRHLQGAEPPAEYVIGAPRP